MAPPIPDDASDYSDEEVGTVLLAVPDGPVDAETKLDHTTSFIGGYPSFPALPAGPSGTSKGRAAAPSAAPQEVACGSCKKPMPLLAQVYCPLPDGENDRTVYVWACASPACRRRDGSIRAYRASVRNEEYVADVERKRAEAARLAAEEREKARKNPFTMNDSQSNGSNLFGNSQPLFGAAPSNPFGAPDSAPAPAKDEAPSAPLSSLQIGEPTTYAPPLPAYQPPQFISTMDEYLTLPESDDESDDDEVDEDVPQGSEWRESGWEKLVAKGVDDIFERFVRRLQSAEDGTNQVLRYDFDAVPLPYSSSSPLFKKLFPGAPTRAPASEEEEVNLAEFYSTKVVPKCQCGSERVFELQLVPQLINTLRPSALSTTGEVPGTQEKEQTEAERRAELERLAKGEARGDDNAAEMEWGTIMVFGCKGDCVGVSEEWVGVEWEAVAA